MKTNDAKPTLLENGSKQEAVLSFLAIEAVALVCFGFAGATGLTILRAAGLCLALFLYPLISNSLRFRSIAKKDLYFLLPVLLLPLFLGFSLFNFAISSGLSFVLDGLVVTIGFLGLGALGFMLSSLDKLKKEWILLGVLSGLGLVVLISLIYTLCAYGPFYAMIYKNDVYYYDGVVFYIAAEGKYLDGFSFVEADLKFALTLPFILACSGVGLLALFFQKLDKKVIAGLSVASSLGALYLILTPHLKAIIALLLVYAVAFLMVGLLKIRSKSEASQKKVDKGVKIGFFMILALVLLGVFILLIDAILVSGGGGFLRNIPLIGKYFEEGAFMHRIETAIGELIFDYDNAGRRSLDIASILFGANSNLIYDIRIFEFQILYQNGFLAFFLLLYFVFFFAYKGYRALTQANDKDRFFVSAILGLAFGGFIYLSLFDSELPLKHPSEIDGIFSTHSTNLLPFTRSNVALLMAFCFGAIYLPDKLDPSRVKASSKETSDASAYQEVKIDE